MKRLHQPLLACTVLLTMTTSGCGIDELPAAVSKGAPIVNGKIHEGHPAVGGFSHSLGGNCSATLIGEKTVLTAAHCTAPGAQHFFRLLGQRWEAEQVIPHPRYTLPQVANDFALVRLHHAPPVEPAVISGVAPEVGQELMLVGIGSTGDSGEVSGFKRMATNVIAEIDDVVFTYYDAQGEVGNVCFGDSGGPSFAVINGQEVQVGVHSYIQGECGEEGNDMRVDVVLDWILEQAGGNVRVGGYPDEEAPTLRFLQPDLSHPLYPAIELTIEASDDTGLSGVELFVDDISGGGVWKAPFVFDLELEPGTHALRAVATDLAGNVAEVRAEIDVLSYKALGEICDDTSQCAAQMCQAHSALEFGYCTQRCRPEKPCPHGLACVATETDFVCAPPPELLEDGGCSLGDVRKSRTGPIPLLLLLLLACHRRKPSR